MATVAEFASWIWDHTDLEGLKKKFCVAWSLWQRHNKLTYQQINPPPHQAFESGLPYRENFQALSSLLKAHVSYNSRWIPPPQGT